MADLRWILLLAGLVFLAGLTVWELRRPRQGRRDHLGPPERSEPELGRLSDIEPDSMGHHSSGAARSHEEIPPLGTPLVISLDEPAVPTIHPIHTAQPSEPLESIERGESVAMEPVAVEPIAVEPVAVEPIEVEAVESIEPIQYAQKSLARQPAQPGGVDEIVLPARAATPIVEWPPEEQRQILSIRLVGATPERLSGRPLRQALAACGFVHGRFGIFHQPGADGRALISAANLNKPGVFDPSSMDFQRFRGLGLFTVLPGPLPPAAALDHLLETAGDLAERLQARLQDENGMPLDEMRLEQMARTVQDMSNGALRSEPAA